MNEAITLQEHRRRDAAGLLPGQRNAVKQREIERKSQAPILPIIKHGTMGGYRKKCRCEPCVSAKVAYYLSPTQMAYKKKRNESTRKKRAAEKAALKKQGAKQ